MRQTIVRDVSDLPTFGFGPRSGPWWGAMGFMALEGMGFAIAVGAYLYPMPSIRAGRSVRHRPISGPGRSRLCSIC